MGSHLQNDTLFYLHTEIVTPYLHIHLLIFRVYSFHYESEESYISSDHILQNATPSYGIYIHKHQNV